MSDDRELIWVTKEQAKQFKELDNAKAQSKLALEVIESKKLDLKGELGIICTSGSKSTLNFFFTIL